MERDEIIRKARMRIHSLEEKEQPAYSTPQSTPPADQNASNFRYQQLELIGQGSIGQVFKANDSVLKRTVALKFLKGHRAGMEERFLREAQSQARVHHANVCKVYEVGEIDNRPFISMQYINGHTLNQAAQDMNLEEKLEVMKKVADAVHAANRTGMIHRDLKPGNILVEKTEDGWQPYVTDFGLAREIDAPDLTRTGVVIGTPAYMSPEQASGVVHELDQRTDVYCLGATFYELLCGKPPFEGKSSMEVLWKIVQEEAPLLRSKQSKVPEDLETIVMKCLEKEPRQRYESARALSEDLARFQDGEPIRARPATWHYRFLKKARKHRAVVVIATLAFAGVILSASFGVYFWWNAAEQAKHAQEFGQEVEKIEGFLRYTYTLPIHDVRKERQIVQQRMIEMKKRIEEIGRTSKGPGYYAIGRGHLALHEYDQSKIHLQAAWNHGYRTPEVSYALGRVFGALYQQNRNEVENLPDEDLRKSRLAEIQKAFLEPALIYMRSSKGTVFEPANYVEALIAFYKGDHNEALTKSRAALSATPWFYQSRKLEGDILLLRGMERQKFGDYEAARTDFGQAGNSYKKAMEIARSDESIYEAECARWIQIQDLEMDLGVPKEDVFKNGIAACDQAIQINADNAEAFNKKSQIYWQWALAVENSGGDHRPLLQKAIEMANGAIRANPNLKEAYINKGNSYRNLARDQRETGEEIERSLLHAIESYQKSVSIQATAWVYNNLGQAFVLKGISEIERGRDANKSFRSAIDTYEKAIAIDPNYAIAYNSMGTAYGHQATFEMSLGKDPRSSLERSTQFYQKAIDLNPKLVRSYNNIGTNYLAMAEFQVSQGLNPVDSLNQGIEFLKKAIELNPSFWQAYENMGATYRWKAEHALSMKQDPSEYLIQARNALQRATEFQPSEWSVYYELGEVELIAAEWAMENQRRPQEFLNTAFAYFQRSLRFNPSEPVTYELLTDYYKLRAKHEIKSQRNPEDEIRKGIEMAQRCISFNPDSAYAYGMQAELYLLDAKSQHSETKRLLSRQKAKEALQKALKLNPNLKKQFEAAFLELQENPAS